MTALAWQPFMLVLLATLRFLVPWHIMYQLHSFYIFQVTNMLCTLQSASNLASATSPSVPLVPGPPPQVDLSPEVSVLDFSCLYKI